MGASLRQGLGQSQADTGRRACDQGSAACELEGVQDIHRISIHLRGTMTKLGKAMSDPMTTI